MLLDITAKSNMKFIYFSFIISIYISISNFDVFPNLQRSVSDTF